MPILEIAVLGTYLNILPNKGQRINQFDIAVYVRGNNFYRNIFCRNLFNTIVGSAALIFKLIIVSRQYSYLNYLTKQHSEKMCCYF